jgi:hypothetical protein
MTTLLINLILTILKSDAIHTLVLSLLEHLANTTTHPLTQEGLTVVKHIVDGTVDITFPVTVESAIVDAAEIVIDAVKVHNDSH